MEQSVYCSIETWWTNSCQGLFYKMTNRWKGNTDDDVSSSEGATVAQIAVVSRIGMSFSYLRFVWMMA
jgi:hypothetical protein